MTNEQLASPDPYCRDLQRMMGNANAFANSVYEANKNIPDRKLRRSLGNMAFKAQLMCRQLYDLGMQEFRD